MSDICVIQVGTPIQFESGIWNVVQIFIREDPITEKWFTAVKLASTFSPETEVLPFSKIEIAMIKGRAAILPRADVNA